MFRRIIETLNETIAGLPEVEKEKIFNSIIVSAFGNEVNAQVMIDKLQQKYPPKNEFEMSLFKEFKVNALLKVKCYLEKIDSISTLIKVADVEYENIPFNLSKEEAEFIASLSNNFYMFIAKDGNLLKDLINNIAQDRRKFTKKEISDELNINQRTFSNWLRIQFGDKYANVRYISFLEYLEINKIFYLKKHEEHFDFKNNAKLYHERLKKGVVFQKKDLIRMAETTNRVASKEAKKVFPDYKRFDVYYYRLAQLILEHLG